VGVCADNQPPKNYFPRPQKIIEKIFAGMVDCSVSLWHEKQGNEALLKKQRSWQSYPTNKKERTRNTRLNLQKLQL
jgi:hypothetical protein